MNTDKKSIQINEILECDQCHIIFQLSNEMIAIVGENGKRALCGDIVKKNKKAM